jgi:lipopolysaccharide export system protein LptA
MLRRSASRIWAVSLAATAALCCGTALADKTDREKPVNVEADRMLVDDAKKESVFEGNVVVTQGTLQLRGDRVIVRQDGEGFSYGIAYGKPATFRQKREGYDEYIDGYAERLEYDGRKDLLQMFAAAKLTKGTDEVQGDYISYNAKTEFFQVLGRGKAADSPADPSARVRAVIQPKPKAPPAAGTPEAASAGTPLKSAPDLNKPPKP